MIRSTVIVLVCILLFGCLHLPIVPAIGSNNTILYVGGSGPGNYTQIQDAVDNTTDGDIVFVFSGSYESDIIIRTQIQLIGENRSATFIEDGTNGVSIFADHVILRGFTIREYGDFWNVCGITISADEVTITDNSIINNKRLKAINLESASYCIITHNFIAHNQYHGIKLDYSSHNIIKNNMILDNRGNGIYLISSNENTITNNTIISCYLSGVIFSDQCENNTIYQNNIMNNEQDNSYDDGFNQWDNNVFGNFWDDYTGNDNNNDGIGDTPYTIPAGTNQDHYPLMKPYFFLQPPINITPRNGLGVTLLFQNTGYYPAYTLEYTITIKGGFFQKINQQHIYNIPFLASEETLHYHKAVFGFGKILILIQTNHDETNYTGFIFGPLVLITG